MPIFPMAVMSLLLPRGRSAPEADAHWMHQIGLNHHSPICVVLLASGIDQVELSERSTGEHSAFSGWVLAFHNFFVLTIAIVSAGRATASFCMDTPSRDARMTSPSLGKVNEWSPSPRLQITVIGPRCMQSHFASSLYVTRMWPGSPSFRQGVARRKRIRSRYHSSIVACSRWPASFQFSLER